MFHIGKFIAAVVNTEAKHADIETLKGDLDSASTRINVSIFHFCFTLPPFP
jgi:hypothetical protein